MIGIELDHAANRESAQVISTERSAVRVFVMPSDEEGMIAQHTVAMLDRRSKARTLCDWPSWLCGGELPAIMAIRYG